MARRTQTAFVCENCGANSPRWEGRCPQCGEWNTLAEFKVGAARGATGGGRTWAGQSAADAVRLRDVAAEESERLVFRSGEMTRTLGGGLVPGSVILVAGDPGIGKSTLLLDVASDVAAHGRALYVTGEESSAQVKMRADRLGIDADDLYLLPSTGLEDVLAQMDRLKPALVVIDSIQTITSGELPSEAGSMAQIRECARTLTEWAKTSGASVVLTGHVTKDGGIAGPRALEHVVDVVLYLEGDPLSSFRLLRAVKNRFGSTNEVGIFEMTEKGMRDVGDPSAHLLNQSSGESVGSVIVPAMEGTRTLLLEVQALTNPSLLPTPRRVASGVDYNRMLLICAVLTRRAGISLASQDVIVNVAGGMRVAEPAADLAMALAIVSSVRDAPIAHGMAAVGELGLSGEIRSVAQLERRAHEVGRLGMNGCIVPRVRNGNRRPVHSDEDLDIVSVSSLREAIGAGLGGRRRAD